MSSLLISAFLFALASAFGTLAVAAALFLGSLLARLPGLATGRLLAAGVGVSVIGQMAYGVVLQLMDNTSQPPVNMAFFVALGVGVAVSYVVVMKSLDVEPGKIPLIWLPAGVAFAAILFLVRTEGIKFREARGYTRGFERLWYLNLPDPPDTLSTPERAVQYYMEQYKILRAANENTGLGKVLTTATYDDVRWFNENYDRLSKEDFGMQMTGIDKVLQDPNQKKAIGLLMLAKPLFGEIQTARDDGKEALVQMSSGQLVRLRRQGPNWKIVGWLGMRAHFEKSDTYERETKALAERLGVPYQPFDPYWDEEDSSMPGMSVVTQGRPRRPRKPRNEIEQLAQAQGGETLVDLSQQTPAPQPTPSPVVAAATPAPAAAAAMASQPAPPPAPTPPPPAPAPPAPTPAAATPAIPGEAPAPAPPVSPAPTPVAPDQPVVVQPTPEVPVEAVAPGLTPTPVPTPRLAVTGVSTDFLWNQYREAVRLLEAADTRGVAAFLRLVSNDDRAWFMMNYLLIADIVTPGVRHESPEKAQLAVLRLMLRNMPKGFEFEPIVRTNAYGFGVAKARERGTRDEYETMIIQEGGMWLLLRMWHVRDFVWTPQLATYKQLKNIPLSPEEQEYVTFGLAPAQARARQARQIVGSGG